MWVFLNCKRKKSEEISRTRVRHRNTIFILPKSIHNENKAEKGRKLKIIIIAMIAN